MGFTRPNDARAEKYTRAGGPAFPLVDEGACVVYGGMTLRDYFAAKALPRMLALAHSVDPNRTPDENIALRCYALADAMLKARDA